MQHTVPDAEPDGGKHYEGAGDAAARALRRFTEDGTFHAKDGGEVRASMAVSPVVEDDRAVQHFGLACGRSSFRTRPPHVSGGARSTSAHTTAGPAGRSSRTASLCLLPQPRPSAHPLETGSQHHPADVPCGTRSRVLVSPKNGTPR
jgi:hypothetical protein